MRSHKSSLLAAASIAMLSAGGGLTGIFDNRGRTTGKVRTYVPSMLTSSDREIAEWNAQVEAKRKAKKGY